MPWSDLDDCILAADRQFVSHLHCFGDRCTGRISVVNQFREFDVFTKVLGLRPCVAMISLN